MKRAFQFEDPLLRGMSRRFRWNWVLLMLIGLFSQVTPTTPQDEATILALFVRILGWSFLLLLVMYGANYFRLLYKNSRRDLLSGAIWGVGISLIVIIVSSKLGGDYHEQILLCGLFGIAFASIFGIYAVRQQDIAPAKAISIGLTTVVVGSGYFAHQASEANSIAATLLVSTLGLIATMLVVSFFSLLQALSGKKKIKRYA